MIDEQIKSKIFSKIDFGLKNFQKFRKKDLIELKKLLEKLVITK